MLPLLLWCPVSKTTLGLVQRTLRVTSRLLHVIHRRNASPLPTSYEIVSDLDNRSMCEVTTCSWHRVKTDVCVEKSTCWFHELSALRDVTQPTVWENNDAYSSISNNKILKYLIRFEVCTWSMVREHKTQTSGTIHYVWHQGKTTGILHVHPSEICRLVYDEANTIWLEIHTWWRGQHFPNSKSSSQPGSGGLGLKFEKRLMKQKKDNYKYNFISPFIILKV